MGQGQRSRGSRSNKGSKQGQVGSQRQVASLQIWGTVDLWSYIMVIPLFSGFNLSMEREMLFLGSTKSARRPEGHFWNYWANSGGLRAILGLLGLSSGVWGPLLLISGQSTGVWEPFWACLANQGSPRPFLCLLSHSRRFQSSFLGIWVYTVGLWPIAGPLGSLRCTSGPFRGMAHWSRGQWPICGPLGGRP